MRRTREGGRHRGEDLEWMVGGRDVAEKKEKGELMWGRGVGLMAWTKWENQLGEGGREPRRSINLFKVIVM